MPALWPKFITSLAQEMTSQDYTRPGGAIVSYPMPKVGTDQVPIFPPTPALAESVKPGNPVNSALTTNPAAFVNAINLNPLSGRYDFGVKVAELYIQAVKSKAQTLYGALHTNNPAAEIILKQGYGIVFERLLREGDLSYEEKLTHPAYADFEWDESDLEAPDLCDIEEDNEKAFNQFLKDSDIEPFQFFEFPCLSGEETQEELKQLFATRLLMHFEELENANNRWAFFEWVDHLGSKHYKDLSGPTYWHYGSTDYPNIHQQCREDIEAAGYDWAELADGVSGAVTYWILQAHTNGSDPEKRVKNQRTSAIQYPQAGQDICRVNRRKLQVSYDREHSPPDNPSKRPKVLTDSVVATFSWVYGYRLNGFTSSKPPYYKKSPAWVKENYEKGEWPKWSKIPDEVADAKGADDILAIDPDKGGVLFKFEQHRVKCAIDAACECEPELEEVLHAWAESGETPDGKVYQGDPYKMMALVTIAYWYACIVKPFQSMPASLPATIPPPLTGIYIPIYYGSVNRLANRLRKAWNTGKHFNTLGMTPQPPSLATATAVGAVYALHLLEFKLLYLGGIPTPVGPVPMVGFVPIVF